MGNMVALVCVHQFAFFPCECDRACGDIAARLSLFAVLYRSDIHGLRSAHKTSTNDGVWSQCEAGTSDKRVPPKANG